MKEIPLTQGMVALVDDDWYEYLMQWKWRYTRSPCQKTGYAVRIEGKRLHQKSIYMHRVIMNTPNNMEVDHDDFDGCNNQTYNLENVTHAENQQHQSMQKNNTSGYIGVHKHYNKWQAQIRVDNHKVCLGTYKTQEVAARERDAAAIIYFGKRAILNFPEEHPECNL